jgi:hypothetical protein
MALTVTVKGKDYEVGVGGDGFFYASDAHGARARAETLAALKAKLAAATKKISIPFVRYSESWNGGSDPTITRGEFTGIHSDGRRILARENGKAAQYTEGQLNGFLTDLDDDEALALRMLAESAQAAKKALRDFLDQHRVRHVHETISKAINGTAEDGG